MIISKSAILRKLAFRLDGSIIFEVWSLQKFDQNRCKNNITKKLGKNEKLGPILTPFWHLLGAPGGSWGLQASINLMTFLQNVDRVSYFSYIGRQDLPESPPWHHLEAIREQFGTIFEEIIEKYVQILLLQDVSQ